MPESRGLPALLAALALAAASFYAFHRLHHALTPFLLAAAFAYVLNPAVGYFEARGLRRGHLVVCGYLASLLVGLASYRALKPVVLSEVETLTASAPVYVAQVQRLAADQQKVLSESLPLPPHVSEKAFDAAVGAALRQLETLPSRALLLVPLLVHALLVPFIGFFFLLDGPAGYDALIQAAPSRHVEQAIHVMSEIDAALGNYIRGILIVAAAITAASFVGLLALRVDNALAVALVSGVSSFVPYLGAVVGALAGAATAVYQYGTLSAGFKVIALFLGIRLADEILLQPVIARHSVHLHPMAFLLALVLGGEMFGFLGLVFAVPAACILKVLLRVGWSWYASERGLSAPEAAAGAGVPYT